MSVDVRCTHADCGQSYEVTEEQIGRTVECQKCKRTFTLQATIASGTNSQVEPARTPERLGRFEVRERLGAGSFGAVYRAYDPTLEREVALKVPHASTLQSETRRARVLTEAKAAAQLRHPNIVPVYEAGKDGDTYYIASAFIEGQTLEDAMANQEFDFRQASKLVMDLAGALQYAHHNGVVHRDIKPANIMLDAQGDPLVMDFGLARLEESESKLTQDGVVLGTPAYMPPEQAAGQLDEIDPASDQYSLGVVLYELLCGSTPFSGPPTMVISLVINQEPDSPRKTNPAIPKDLETICLKSISKDPVHRYASCHALAEDLRRWLDGEPIQARRVNPVERFARWCRRNPIMAGLTGAAVLLLVQVGLIASIGYISTTRALRDAESERTRADSALGTLDNERRRAESVLGTVEGQRKRAEDALAAVERERKRAADAQRQEENERERAKQASQRESAERKIAETQRQRATTALARSEWNEYLLHLTAAYRAWEYGDELAAWDHLNACRADLRGWEYDYVYTLSRCNQHTLQGHSGSVSSLSFGPKGERLVSGSSDKTVRVWDVETRQEVLTLKGHTDEVTSVSFSPNGKLIVSGSTDKTVRVWDAATGRELFTLEGHTDAVKCVMFSLDSREIVTGSADTTARVWDTLSGEELLTLEGHADDVASALFLEGRRWVLSGSIDGAVKLWRVTAGGETRWKVLNVKNILTGEDRAGDVDSLKISAAGPSIIVSSGGVVKYLRTDAAGIMANLGVAGQLKKWKIPAGKALTFLSEPAIGFSDGTIAWQWKSTQPILARVHAAPVTSTASYGRWIASGSKDGCLKLWDPRWISWRRRSSKVRGPSSSSLLITHDPISGRYVHTGGILCASFGPAGRVICSASLDQTVRVWNVPARERPQYATQTYHWGGLINVSFSPDGQRIVGGTRDNAVKVYEFGRVPQQGHRQADETLSLKGHTDSVVSVSFSPDGRRIVSGSFDRTVKVWDVATGQELLTLDGHAAAVTSVSFSPDDKRIVSGSFDKTIKVWDAVTGQETLTLNGHTDGVTSVSFSPSGDRIVGASKDKTIKVWDAATGQELLTLQGHGGPVWCVSFSPDGQRIVSGSSDNTVKVWDTTWGDATLTLYHHTLRVSSVSFSPDGRQIVSASMDGSIRLWRASVVWKL